MESRAKLLLETPGLCCCPGMREVHSRGLSAPTNPPRPLFKAQGDGKYVIKTSFTAEQQEGGWVVTNSVQTAPSLRCSQEKAILDVVAVKKPPNHHVITLPLIDNNFISFFSSLQNHAGMVLSQLQGPVPDV